MLEASQRAAVRGPTFIRLLARLTDADVPSPRQSLSDRLSQWIDWNHAVALSTALDSPPSVDPFAEPAPATAMEEDCARVRAALSRAIAEDPAFDPGARRGGARASDGAEETPPEFLFFRQRYLALQQSMETGVGHLRSRLRDQLADRSAELARLAAVDAVMERALGRRERRLLAAAPTLLAPHFERLRLAAQGHCTDTSATSPAPASAEAAPRAPDAWLDAFRRDMRNLLLAELDVRLQPAEGLLAALRTHPLG
nr:DUF3348 domain-containing protein [Pseudoxanthomonas sp.]